jgi:hypothetical protein
MLRRWTPHLDLRSSAASGLFTKISRGLSERWTLYKFDPVLSSHDVSARGRIEAESNPPLPFPYLTLDISEEPQISELDQFHQNESAVDRAHDRTTCLRIASLSYTCTIPITHIAY